MKKSISLLSITLGIIFLFAVSAQAQHQRLGIAPQPTINLNGQNASLEVEAFCLDRHKIVDGTYNYNNVLASNSKATVKVGNRKLSLQRAIDENLIRVESLLSRTKFGSGIGLRFVSLTDAPVTIQIQDSLALGENPGAYSNATVLATLKKARANPANESRNIQDQLWEADVDRMRLEALGYTSVEEFQRAYSLPAKGLDAVTKYKLREAEAALIARFDAVDLRVARSDTNVQSVSDNIRKFQEETGVKNPTGVYSPDVRARFESYEEAFPVTKELKEYNTDIESSLVLRVKSSIGDENFYTLHSPIGKLYEGNSVSEINALISRIPPTFEKIYLDLDFPSAAKAQAFKTSFEIAQTRPRATLIEGNPASKNVLFSSKRTFEIVNATQPQLARGEYSATIGLRSTNATEVNRSWRIRASSRLKQSVVKFTDAFKVLIGRREKKSLASIIERARAADEARTGKLDVKVSFMDEFGRIQLGKTLFGQSIQITAE